MKALLDTCVLSEVQQAKPNPVIVSYLQSLDESKMFISALTIGELTKGIDLLEPGKRRTTLESWLTGLEDHYSGRILPVSSDVARIWGELLAKAKRQGIGLPAIDGLIAATAIHHGLHLVTRNVSDFKATGALLINPWETGK